MKAARPGQSIPKGRFGNFQFGGEIKAKCLWGPVGFGFVLGGQTAPNLSCPNNKWVEAIGGMTFTRGQR